jgi:hypothetical protein
MLTNHHIDKATVARLMQLPLEARLDVAGKLRRYADEITIGVAPCPIRRQPHHAERRPQPSRSRPPSNHRLSA